jgi:hypothetical protein
MSLILLAVAAIGKAISDASMHGKLSGTFWDETVAWKNKWKNGDPKQGEKFLGSSTVFVFVTSGFHLMQFVYLNAFFISLVTYKELVSPVADFFILGIGFRLIFEITYRNIGKSK